MTKHTLQTKPAWRLLIHDALHPSENMAIDEAIFQHHVQNHSTPTLRLYLWHPHCFSFGYFQNPLELFNESAHDIPCVRRMTGGFILMHGNDLSYSVTCSPEDIHAHCPINDSFKILCEFLVAAYKKCGLQARFADSQQKQSEKHAFCLSGLEKYDIVINDKKIGGNAQRRRKNTLFQHGSIPLENYTNEANSSLKEAAKLKDGHATFLNEALQKPLNVTTLEELLVNAFRETFNVELIQDELTFEEKELADFLLANKYNTAQWNLERKDILRAQQVTC